MKCWFISPSAKQIIFNIPTIDAVEMKDVFVKMDISVYKILKNNLFINLIYFEKYKCLKTIYFENKFNKFDLKNKKLKIIYKKYIYLLISS